MTFCPNLEFFNLYSFNGQSQHVKAILTVVSGCRKLTKVCLPRQAVSFDDTLALCSQLPSTITNMDLMECIVTDAALNKLSVNCPNLTALNLSSMHSAVSELVMCNLIRCCRQLKSVEATSCSFVTDMTMVCLSEHCAQLNSFNK